MATNAPPMEIPEEAPDLEEPPTPTPSFLDDFDNGLDPVWAVHYGDPFIQEGQLTSNVGAGLAAGDPTWRNYQIDFDVDATQGSCAFTENSNSLGVRVADFDHAYWFVFTGCTSAWSLFPGGVQNGIENVLAGTQTEVSTNITHITINVEGPKLSAYGDGSLLSSVEEVEIESGGIFLQAEAGTFYDNFRVTLLP